MIQEPVLPLTGILRVLPKGPYTQYALTDLPDAWQVAVDHYLQTEPVPKTLATRLFVQGVRRPFLWYVLYPAILELCDLAPKGPLGVKAPHWGRYWSDITNTLRTGFPPHFSWLDRLGVCTYLTLRDLHEAPMDNWGAWSNLWLRTNPQAGAAAHAWAWTSLVRECTGWSALYWPECTPCAPPRVESPRTFHRTWVLLYRIYRHTCQTLPHLTPLLSLWPQIEMRKLILPPENLLRCIPRIPVAEVTLQHKKRSPTYRTEALCPPNPP